MDTKKDANATLSYLRSSDRLKFRDKLIRARIRPEEVAPANDNSKQRSSRQDVSFHTKPADRKNGYDDDDDSEEEDDEEDDDDDDEESGGSSNSKPKGKSMCPCGLSKDQVFDMAKFGGVPIIEGICKNSKADGSTGTCDVPVVQHGSSGKLPYCICSFDVE